MVEPMKRTFLLALGFALLTLASAQTQYYSLKLSLDGKPLEWDFRRGYEPQR